MNKVFKGYVKNGRVELYEIGLYHNLITSLEGKKVEVILRKEIKQRSNNLNKYYWSVVVDLLSEKLGYKPEEMHEILKYKFLGYEIITIGTERMLKINSSAILTVEDFQKYIDNIKVWAAEIGCFIPDPDGITR